MKISEYLEGNLCPEDSAHIDKTGWTATCPVCMRDEVLAILVHPRSIKCHNTAAACDVEEILSITGTTLDEFMSAENDMPVSFPDPEVAETSEDAESSSTTEGRLTPKAVVEFVCETYSLCRSEDGIAFAIPRAGDRRAVEIRTLGTAISGALWSDRQQVVGTDVLNTAKSTLEGIASQYEHQKVGLRSVYDDSLNRVYLDLGDSAGRIVEVTKQDWHVLGDVEYRPLFRRNSTMKTLPEPRLGGNPDALREILRLDAGDERWRLIWGWLVASLFESMPRPFLWARGPQGSGKSTRARMIHNIVEPRSSLGSPVASERDASALAKQRYLLSFDNVSTISGSVSDWLCRVVTGAEDDRRQLHTDDTLRTGYYMRTGIATSITLPAGLRSDAIQRLVQIVFERMPDTQRTSEANLWREYEDAHAEILGALLCDVSSVLVHLPEVQADASRTRPRMADYADVLTALDLAYGIDGQADSHRSVYINAIDTSMADRALDDPLAVAVLKVVAASPGQVWDGRPGELLELVKAGRDDDETNPAWLPKGARGMGAQLDRMSEILRPVGVEVRKLPRQKGGIPVRLRATQDLTELELLPASTRHPEPAPGRVIGGN